MSGCGASLGPTVRIESNARQACCGATFRARTIWAAFNSRKTADSWLVGESRNRYLIWSKSNLIISSLNASLCSVDSRLSRCKEDGPNPAFHASCRRRCRVLRRETRSDNDSGGDGDGSLVTTARGTPSVSNEVYVCSRLDGTTVERKQPATGWPNQRLDGSRFRGKRQLNVSLWLANWARPGDLSPRLAGLLVAARKPPSRNCIGSQLSPWPHQEQNGTRSQHGALLPRPA